MLTNQENRHVECHGYFLDVDSILHAAESLAPVFPDSNQPQLVYFVCELVRGSHFTELDLLGVKIVSGPIRLN